MIKLFQLLLSLSVSYGFLAQAESAKIVKSSEPIELRTYQIDLDVDSKIDKFDNYLTPCLPALLTQKEVYNLLLSDNSIVEVQKFEYLNANEVLLNCPNRGVFRVRVRYLAK